MIGEGEELKFLPSFLKDALDAPIMTRLLGETLEDFARNIIPALSRSFTILQQEREVLGVVARNELW